MSNGSLHPGDQHTASTAKAKRRLRTNQTCKHIQREREQTGKTFGESGAALGQESVGKKAKNREEGSAWGGRGHHFRGVFTP